MVKILTPTIAPTAFDAYRMQRCLHEAEMDWFDRTTDALADQMAEAATQFQSGFQRGGLSASAGFAAVSGGAIAIVNDAVKNRSPFVQALSGLGMAGTRLFGALPFGMVDWVGKSFEEAPHGLVAVAAKAVELAASGMVAGAGHVVTELRDAVNGEWSEKSVFEMAFRFGVAVGEGVLLVWGAKSIVSGGVKMGGAFGGGVEALAMAPAFEVVVARLSVSAVALTRGAMDLGMGAMLVGRPQSVSDADLIAALERRQGNQSKAARDLGISQAAVSSRINRAAEGSDLAKFKKTDVRRYPSKGVPQPDRQKVGEADLAAVLEKYNGNQARAADELGITSSAISSRVKRAGPDSPLAKFKELNGMKGLPEGTRHNIPQKVSILKLAEALKNHNGNRRLAAGDVGMSSSAVDQRVRRAGSNSPLFKFKKKKK